MNPFSVDSDRWGNEALNASPLQFLRSIKRLTATIFYSALNPYLTVTFYGKSSLTLYRHYFLKEIHRLTIHRRYRYFLK